MRTSAARRHMPTVMTCGFGRGVSARLHANDRSCTRQSAHHDILVANAEVDLWLCPLHHLVLTRAGIVTVKPRTSLNQHGDRRATDAPDTET